MTNGVVPVLERKRRRPGVATARTSYASSPPLQLLPTVRPPTLRTSKRQGGTAPSEKASSPLERTVEAVASARGVCPFQARESGAWWRRAGAGVRGATSLEGACWDGSRGGHDGPTDPTTRLPAEGRLRAEPPPSIALYNMPSQLETDGGDPLDPLKLTLDPSPS